MGIARCGRTVRLLLDMPGCAAHGAPQARSDLGMLRLRPQASRDVSQLSLEPSEVAGLTAPAWAHIAHVY